MKISYIAKDFEIHDRKKREVEAELFKNKEETPYSTFLTGSITYGYYFLLCPFRLIIRKNSNALFQVVIHQNIVQKVNDHLINLKQYLF